MKAAKTPTPAKSRKPVKTAATVCPVGRSMEIVGDKWTVLVLREMHMGATRFEEIQIQTEATPQMVATRLKALEENGLVEREPYSQRPLRYEYRLTEKGRAFYPVLHALRGWGETWTKTRGEEIAVHHTHRECGHDIGLALVCPVCNKAVERSDLDAKLSPAYEKEREQRRLAFKENKV